jgi:primosomal protein N' (replication factor Y) (superfamily II helicase)
MIVQVALPLPIDKIFSYRLPESMAPSVRLFSRVKVPFRHRSLVGFIVAVVQAEVEGEDLKAIEELLDPIPLLSRSCYELCDWASRHYVAPVGLALRYALSPAISIERHCTVRAGESTSQRGFGQTMQLKKAYELFGRKSVHGSLSSGTMALHDVFTDSAIEPSGAPDRGTGFHSELFVGGVADRLERYCSLVAAQLREGKNCLMLLPDRHGVGDFFSRALARRFPGAVFWFSSAGGARKKAEVYFRARNRGGQLVLGNKSAVFLPLRSLGLVIVERPEEDQYRNEDTFKFNAVRLAIKKAEIEGVPLILGSVSPSVEVMKWVEEGGPTLRRGPQLQAPMVSSITGERNKGQGPGLPPEALVAVRDVLDRGGNVAVHTPRRAYAMGLNCSACGQGVSCDRCGSYAVSYNREEGRLVCGTCKKSTPYTEQCPACRSPFIRFFDAGAEYLEAALREEFPDRPIVRLSGEKDRRPKGFSGSYGSKGGGNLIVGTQILSKLYGFHADLLILHGWDSFLRSGGGGFRALEKMFQVFRNLLDALTPQELLVCGSGREAFDVSPFLHPEGFYADELARRRMADFPPYERFFLINVLKRTESAGERIIRRIEKLVTVEVREQQMLGPIEVKGQYAWRIILKGDGQTLYPLLSSLYRLPGVHIEADPLYV